MASVRVLSEEGTMEGRDSRRDRSVYDMPGGLGSLVVREDGVVAGEGKDR